MLRCALHDVIYIQLIINVYLTGEGGVILYVSKLYAGTVNDDEMLKREFPPAVHWFENKEVRIDWV